jgi:hypothetical protein
MVLKMRRKSACEDKCPYVCEFIYVYVFISASPILLKIDWQAFIEIRTNVMPLECNISATKKREMSIKFIEDRTPNNGT